MFKATTLALAAVLTVGACNGPTTPADTTTDTGTGPTTAEFECDPVGPNPAMGGLLNAPLEADVEVIVKSPTHPGDPGPDDLP